MKQSVIALLLLFSAGTWLFGQNSKEEADAFYYIKKAYSHSKSSDKSKALEYLKTFENYLSAKLNPGSVADSTSIYYARTLIKLYNPNDSTYHSAINWNNAYRYSIKLAERGNSECQYIIGVMYYKGCGVQQDYAESVRWYRLSAEQGNAGAQNNLGFMYYNGNGVQQDYAESVRWYRLAAKQGHTGARNALRQLGETW